MDLIIFDLDGTLIKERTIFAIAKEYGFLEEVVKVIESPIKNYMKSKIIAGFLKGLTVNEFLDIIKKIPLMDGAEEVSKTLKNKGYKLGIISDSYTLVTEYFKEKLGFDFSVANRLEVKNGILTGKICMPMGWLENRCFCKQSVCKRAHLRIYAKKYGVSVKDCVAVGDGPADLCMLDEAGLGIAFNPKTPELLKYAKIVIDKEDLREILSYL